MSDNESHEVVATTPLGTIPTVDLHADEPMTDKQAAVLRALCDKRGETFDPTLTRRQAADRIETLRD